MPNKRRERRKHLAPSFWRKNYHSEYEGTADDFSDFKTFTTKQIKLFDVTERIAQKLIVVTHDMKNHGQNSNSLSHAHLLTNGGFKKK